MLPKPQMETRGQVLTHFRWQVVAQDREYEEGQSFFKRKKIFLLILIIYTEQTGAYRGRLVDTEKILSGLIKIP